MKTEFQNSEIYVLPIPTILLLYFQNKIRLDVDLRKLDLQGDSEVSLFMYDLIDLMFKNIYEILDDKAFMVHELTHLINTSFLVNIINLQDPKEMKELINVLEKTMKELADIIIYHDILKSNFVVHDVNNATFSLEVEIKN